MPDTDKRDVKYATAPRLAAAVAEIIDEREAEGGYSKADADFMREHAADWIARNFAQSPPDRRTPRLVLFGAGHELTVHTAHAAKATVLAGLTKHFGESKVEFWETGGGCTAVVVVLERVCFTDDEGFMHDGPRYVMLTDLDGYYYCAYYDEDFNGVPDEEGALLFTHDESRLSADVPADEIVQQVIGAVEGHDLHALRTSRFSLRKLTDEGDEISSRVFDWNFRDFAAELQAVPLDAGQTCVLEDHYKNEVLGIRKVDEHGNYSEERVTA